MSALNEQPGGTHYKSKAIQPIQYIHANGIGYCEGNVIKYVSRWRDKNGLQDLLKARHYIDLLIELEGLEKAEFGQQNTIDYRSKDERMAEIGRKLAEGVRRVAGGAVCTDPRTVAGVDVSFPTEKHMNFAPEQEECDHDFGIAATTYRPEKSFYVRGAYFKLCLKCGAVERSN
jgi:hypothetical protein